VSAHTASSPNPNPKSHPALLSERPVTHTTPPPPEGPAEGYALRIAGAAELSAGEGALFAATPNANAVVDSVENSIDPTPSASRIDVAWCPATAMEDAGNN
jgi:hypothetical protein